MTAKFSINSCEALGVLNTVLIASTRSYHVPQLHGPLSIKAVFSGSAVVAVENRTLLAQDNSFIVVNDGQPYAFTVDSLHPTTMFCVFFARGFVEDVWRTTITPDSKLLDNWNVEKASFTPRYFERVEVQTASILPSLHQLRRLVSSKSLTRARWEESFIRVATELVHSEQQVHRRMNEIPAMKDSTRRKICRRLMRGRDFLLSFASESLRLDDVARHACLSSYHFHRAFTRFFGKTPHRFLSDYRLSRIATQLRHTRRSATELCLENGFESFPSFSRLFRHRYGMSPREYRRTNR